MAASHDGNSSPEASTSYAHLSRPRPSRFPSSPSPVEYESGPAVAEYHLDHTKYSEDDHWDWNDSHFHGNERDALITDVGDEKRGSSASVDSLLSAGRSRARWSSGQTPTTIVVLAKRVVSSRKFALVFSLLALVWVFRGSQATRDFLRSLWDEDGHSLEEGGEEIVLDGLEEPDYVRPEHAVTGGGYGSTVTLENLDTFTYLNVFGGRWNSTPFSNAAFAQIDVPPLSTPWNFSAQTIAGVNLGGWLVLEPFITPSLFQPYENAEIPAVDEYTLSINLGSTLNEVLQAHYATFITERDFAEIASGGLNWVRIPLPYWAIEVWDEEPFLEKVSWEYFLKAVVWARKYGLRINLDLHTVPGSQNGWNHSGRLGSVNFMRGKMGIVNAQRTLNYVRALSEFCSRPEISPVIPMLGVANEALAETIGIVNLKAFYYQSYKTVRSASGINRGPLISFHDGFAGRDTWHGFLKGGERLALDSHLYLCFGEQTDDDLALQAYKPCYQWARGFNRTMSRFGFTYSGEWSLAVNDCGTYLNNVGMGSRYDGTYPTAEEPAYERVGSCERWNDYTTWDDELKESLRSVALGQMDAYRNWFFWTWKTGLIANTNKFANPMWSYSLGLKEGYIPPIPRGYEGFCASQAQELDFPPPKVASWSGHVRSGSGRIIDSEVQQWSQFPPTAFKGVSKLVEGGKPIILRSPGLAPPTTATTVSDGPWFAKVSGVKYDDAWIMDELDA